LHKAKLSWQNGKEILLTPMLLRKIVSILWLMFTGVQRFYEDALIPTKLHQKSSEETFIFPWIPLSVP